jgi:hypothetical protein
MALKGIVRTFFADDRSTIPTIIRGHGVEAEIGKGEKLVSAMAGQPWMNISSGPAWGPAAR